MLLLNNVHTAANTIWAILESLAIVVAALFAFNRMFKRIEKRFDAQDLRLGKIDYALFNSGKTGLVNKVDLLLEDFQIVKTDVAIIKAKRPTR
jgi:hypothetical protein